MNCNKQNGKIKKDARYGILMYIQEIIINSGEQKGEIIRDIITAEKCYAIFENIKDVDYVFLGFDPK